MGGWKDSARRVMVGPEVVLQNGGGELRIRPKKLSSSAYDALEELERTVFRDPANRARARKYREHEQKLKAAKEAGEKSDLDAMDLLDVYPEMPAEHRNAMYRIAVSGGIGWHNFVDDAGSLINGGLTFDEKTIAEIIDWGPLAEECFLVVEGWNHPLARKSGTRSETSPSGSSGEPSSATTGSSSPTGATPSS